MTYLLQYWNLVLQGVNLPLQNWKLLFQFTLSENEKGYTKEINLVSWNGGEPKYDIRNWHPDREKCGKGITLTEEEARNLMNALKETFEE
jgi:hypothetical protein